MASLHFTLITFSLSWDHFRSVLFNSRLFTSKSGVPGADIGREGWVRIDVSTAGESVKAIKNSDPP